MKRIIGLLLSVLFVFSLSSCSTFKTMDEESKIYEDTVNSLFKALDSKDENAVFELFRRQSEKKIPSLKIMFQSFLRLIADLPTKSGGTDL